MHLTVPTRNSAWVRLSKGQSAKIHGLVFDVPRYNCNGKTIRGFGVCQDASLPLPSGTADKPPPLPISGTGPTIPSWNFTHGHRRYHLSTASLDDIAALYVRRKMVGPATASVQRCVGLQIVHLDSSTEILGRWDPRDRQSISKLYDSSEGVLKALAFQIFDRYKERGVYTRFTQVESISVEVTDMPWDYRPLDPSLIVPASPPDHASNCNHQTDVYPNEVTYTRMFDCSQRNQVYKNPH